MMLFRFARPFRARQRLFRPLLEMLEDRVLLSVLYDESVSGDLSNKQATPTALVLGTGTNSVKGTVGGSDTQDWVTVHVPTGLTLSALVLASYVSSDSQGFTGVQSGTSFVGDAFTASSYLGYAHFGTGATNGASGPTNLVGANLLPIMGNTSLASGSKGFQAPLPSGDYTFLIQQLGSSTSYQFDFNTTASAPAVQHFAVTAPSTSPAGSPVSVTVTAQDASNATVTSYTGTVHFTKSDTGPGTIVPADYTFTANDHGVHVFASSATLVTAGAQTITATDSAAAATGKPR
jgi:hypothetical protein